MRRPLDPAVAKGRNALVDCLTDLESGSHVTVALSGGADSLALAACLGFSARKRSWQAAAVVVDHGLQAGSADVAARAARQAEQLGLVADVVRVDVGERGGMENAARLARYGVLDNLDTDAVLLAHTLDDQAETVLMGLGRGSGARSIAGMAVIDGKRRRPFLGMRRTETEQMCRASGLEWWDDPHNRDSAFRRVRVRHEVLPLLEDVLGGGVAEALAKTARQLQDDNAALDELACSVSRTDHVPTLAVLSPAVRSRVLRMLALRAGAIASELNAGHLSELDRLVTDWHGQIRVELPGQISFVRNGDLLTSISTPVGR